MTTYQEEQLEALKIVVQHLSTLSADEIAGLKEKIADYMAFRNAVEDFLEKHFSNLCTRTCFESELSACCSKDGIITFFADIVINTLHSSTAEIERLFSRLQDPHTGFKCVYLGENGCLMRIQPIICKMFLCDRAEREILATNPLLKKEWEELAEQKKRFTWPDRPILFDFLEEIFIQAGLSSPLMYLHNSPGLVRVKQHTMKKKV